ncbi:DUF669 domain-containing protein [Limosilactobacillus difficilis]|uniref:DUF669 domain-containing protein n=1 Tax=Limosilactobacillus difficilis TaxID=2991838 RepID=UPI0024B88418|nr:DUF669 domain-containing protein [Limosilactobacillus difficilis]
MSLLKAYKNATNGWDAKKDNINTGYEDIPAGDYTAIMNKAEHFVSKKSGFEALTFDMQVIEGDYAGRHERVFVNLADTKKDGSKMPDFVVDRAIKTVAKVAALSNVNLEDSDFDGNTTDVIEKIVEKFRGNEGATVKMHISERPNKKDPDNPYRSYDFAETPESTIKDEDLPTGSNSSDDGTANDDALPF